MAKATITLPNGGSVIVEGSPNEVESIVKRLAGAPPAKKSSAAPPAGRSSGPSSVKDYVLELRESKFFDKPRGLTEVKDALAAEGHHAPITTLSGVMLGLVKGKELRRMKGEKDQNWKYARR